MTDLPEITSVQMYPHTNGFRLDWQAKGFGFGIILFTVQDDKVILDSECMSKEFVKKVLDKFLESCKIPWDPCMPETSNDD